MAKSSYDPKCYELAEAFLEDYIQRSQMDDVADDLAREIQETIESFLDDASSPLLSGDAPRLKEK